MCCFVFSYGASQRRPCVRIGLTHAYLSHVKMTLANAKSVNRQTLENVVRNAASEFTRRAAIASLASLRSQHIFCHWIFHCWMAPLQNKIDPKNFTVRVKSITGSLVIIETLFPQNYVTITVLKVGWIHLVTITVTVQRPQSPLHFRWFPITILKVIWINFPQLPLPSWNVFKLES